MANNASRILGYEADLLGMIQQALAGLQGYDAMALELLQNADDARAKSVQFNVCDDALIVSNDARFSSCGLKTRRCPWLDDGNPDGKSQPCNFHALMRIASRSKIQDTSQIGRFGIGFNSVYQVTDSPTIRTGEVEVRLEPLGDQSIVKSIEELNGTAVVLIWAKTATDTRKALKPSPILIVAKLSIA